MEAFLFQPMWMFLFLSVFAFWRVGNMGVACIGWFHPSLADEIERQGSRAHAIYTIVVLVVIGLIPIFLSACALLARFGIMWWSWWLIGTFVLAVIFATICAVIDNW